jgi:TPR repeat protein
MCGTEPLRPLLRVPNKFRRASHEIKPSSANRPQGSPRPGFWKLIPVVVVVTALMVVTSFSHKTRKRNPTEESPAGEGTATSGQPKLENAGAPQIARSPVRGVEQFVARKLRTAQTIAAKEADPVELWKAVKRGSVNAEVALANLYLEGEAVPRNCEQAHMLLSAASMKGSKAADDYLNGSYAERCERNHAEE